MTEMEYDMRVEEINKWEKSRLKELKQYV